MATQGLRVQRGRRWLASIRALRFSGWGSRPGWSGGRWWPFGLTAITRFLPRTVQVILPMGRFCNSARVTINSTSPDSNSGSSMTVPMPVPALIRETPSPPPRGRARIRWHRRRGRRSGQAVDSSIRRLREGYSVVHLCGMRGRSMVKRACAFIPSAFVGKCLSRTFDTSAQCGA